MLLCTLLIPHQQSPDSFKAAAQRKARAAAVLHQQLLHLLLEEPVPKYLLWERRPPAEEGISSTTHTLGQALPAESAGICCVSSLQVNNSWVPVVLQMCLLQCVGPCSTGNIVAGLPRAGSLSTTLTKRRK